MPMELIDSKLDLELSASICGWDALEKRLGKEDIIDMNLSDRVEPKNYAYRYDVLKDLEYFLGLKEIQNHTIIYRKLNAHRYHLMRLIGEIVPFEEYLFNTMGIKPILYTDKKIEAVKDIVNDLLDRLGLKMRENVRDQLNELDKAVAYEDFPKLFDDHHRYLYERIKETTGIETDFNTKYKQIDEDISMIAEIRGDGRDFDITFNMFFMRKDRAEGLKYLSTHEISGHAVQFSYLRRQADEGRLPRYLTYMTLAEPLQFGSEGLAESLQYFYPEMFSQEPLTQALFAMDRLRRVVTNNAAVRLNQGEGLHSCVDYMYANYPERPRNYVAHRLSDMWNKSSYSMVYSPGLESFREIAFNHPDKYKFLASAYQDFLMPEQIEAQVTKPIIDFV